MKRICSLFISICIVLLAGRSDVNAQQIKTNSKHVQTQAIDSETLLKNSLRSQDTIVFKAKVVLDSASKITKPREIERWDIQLSTSQIEIDQLKATFQYTLNQENIQRYNPKKWGLAGVPAVNLGIRHAVPPDCPPNAKCSLLYFQRYQPDLTQKNQTLMLAIIKHDDFYYAVLYNPQKF